MNYSFKKISISFLLLTINISVFPQPSYEADYQNQLQYYTTENIYQHPHFPTFNPYPMHKFTGDIASIEIEEKTSEKIKLYRKYTFSTQGYLENYDGYHYVMDYYIDDYKKVAYSQNYKYNANNKIIEFIEQKNNSLSTTSYKYNNNDKIIYTETKYDDGKISIIEFKYDNQGRIIEQSGISGGDPGDDEWWGGSYREIFSYNNLLKKRVIYDYDKDDKVITDFSYSFIYSYNNKQLPIKIERYSIDGKLLSWIEYLYDNNENIINEKQFTANLKNEDPKLTVFSQSQYNNNNRVIEQKYIYTGNRQSANARWYGWKIRREPATCSGMKLPGIPV